MFSSERLFEVTMANGEVHRGLAPRHFCWNRQGTVIAEDETTDGVEGHLAARIVDRLPGNQVAVEIPDGEVIAVRESQVVQRPTEIQPPNGVPPTEHQRHVPV
jgi:hypothetical protein